MATILPGFIGGLGTTEVILILVVVLILFGARKIPEFARGLGNGIREFRNATQNVKHEIEREVESAGQNNNGVNAKKEPTV